MMSSWLRKKVISALALAVCAIGPLHGAYAAGACATAPANLRGWYGMMVQGINVGVNTAKYQVAAALFDGKGNLALSHLYSSGGTSSSALGTYLQNADCTFTVTLSGTAAGTFTVALNNAGEAVGIETDSTAVAKVFFKPQYPVYVPVQKFTASSLNGTFAANCDGPLTESSDLNLVTFNNGSLTGTDPYNSAGGFMTANVPYTGTVTVNSDGTFAGTASGLGLTYDFYGVLGDSNTDVQYIYTNVAGGVPTNAFASCTGKVAPAPAATSVNLAPYFNVDAVTSNGTSPANGGIDGSGYAYSSNELGGSVTWNGLLFPIGPANLPDAVTGRQVALPAGKFSSLYLLGGAVYGPHTGTIVVTYTDGTTATFSQGFSDWGLLYLGNYTNYPNEAFAAAMPNRVTPSGAVQAGPWYLYGYAFALNNTKTLASISLPSSREIMILSAVVTP